jgi:hypothetical protein
MRAWFHCTGAELRVADPEHIIGCLAAEQHRRRLSGGPEQDFAWHRQILALQAALASGAGDTWTVVLEFELTRLERRIDAVILTDRAIICCEFKTEARGSDALREAEDYALRLRDFHAGSRGHPIFPLLVAGEDGFRPPAQQRLPLLGLHDALRTGSAGLAQALDWLQRATPEGAVPLDAAAWLAADYAPVPTIIEAARRLFERHDVVELGLARAAAGNLTRTADAVAREIAAARAEGRHVVIFVTGIPGAGKTLCGLNLVFRSNVKAAFLTGNAPLVRVLRAALYRDAISRGRDRQAAEEEVEGFIQDVHRFLASHVRTGSVPPEEVIVFDEAQRAWNQAKAAKPARNRKTFLTLSEPAHALDIMRRRGDWSAIVALIGNGQEINTGEAGLSEWGLAIARGGWTAVAPARVIGTADALQRLVDTPQPWLRLADELDLTVPIRAIRNGAVSAWVEAVLDDDRHRAAQIAAETDLPVFLTRDMASARTALRGFARGHRRAGFVRSAGGRRLRGEGFAAEVGLDDAADWFLRRFPDIRASDALEAAATEYACQGLELDVVAVAWDADLRRGLRGWAAFQLSGGKWQRVQNATEATYIRNTYRVLLTRARYETVIWVPRGSRAGSAFHDETRDAARYDAIADFLHAAGARPLEHAEPTPADAPAGLLL